MHGGAPGSGAPKGKRNGAYVDGAHTGEAIVEKRWANRLANDLISENKIPPISVRVRQVEGSVHRVVEAPDGEEDTWRHQLEYALGTASKAFVDACLHRLLSACRLPGQAAPTSTSVSAALAIIQSLKPENEIQAALAVDAACLHAASTNVLSRLPLNGERRIVAMANAAARLERAFHNAIETFYKIKRGNKQTIRVEKVIVEQGAQAIVGNVKR